MIILKTKWFARYARHERISDKGLFEAIERAERGLIDADLGGGIIKQRVARPGKGRSGGYRMIIAYREKDRAIFLFAFAKSEREDISSGELLTAREIARKWFDAKVNELADAVADDEIQEVTNGEKEA